MSASFDYSFRIVKVKRGTENTASSISYTALPLEVRGTLEMAWQERLGLRRWCILEPRLESSVEIAEDQLRAIARDMLADIADVWESTATEIAIIIAQTTVRGPRFVERGTVVKGEARKQRERIARKLGKGVKHSRHGITLEGDHNTWPTWDVADRFVRGTLTDDELRAVRVSWHRTHYENFDQVRNEYHTIYADAEHLLSQRNTVSKVGYEWQAVRHTLDPQIAEVVEALSGEWHGTGLELLEAASALELTH
jgi:hypothetical protein